MVGFENGLVLATITASFLAGGVLTFLVNSWDRLHEPLKLDARREARLGMCFTGTLMLMMLVGGYLVDKWGVQNALVLGSLLVGFGLGLLGSSTKFGASLFSVGVLGGAAAVLQIASSVAMPTAFVGPEHAVRYAPQAMNVGYIFFGLGIVCMPALGNLAVYRAGFRKGMLLLGLLSLLPAAVAAVAHRGDFPHPADAADVPALFADFRLWVVAVAVFLFYGVQTSVTAWAPDYLSELSSSKRLRYVALTGFWLCFLGSRFLGSYLAGGQVYAAWNVFLLALGTTIVLANMIGFDQPGNGALSCFFLGGGLGPLFPTLAGIIYLTFHAQPAMAFGVICAMGTAGRLIFVPVVRSCLRRNHVRYAIWVTMILCLLITAPALVLLSF